MTPPDASSSPDFVQSLARGLAVIRAFDANNAELTLSDVARFTDMPRAAARRFLRTLETLGYVRSHEGLFMLTPRVLELGHGYLSALPLSAVVQPHLEMLARSLDESASAAVLDDADIVYVARVPTRRIMSIGIDLGTRFPAYATSMGRVMLAGLTPSERLTLLRRTERTAFTPGTVTDESALAREIETVREQGWSIVDGELEEGLRSVAAPVHGPEGTVIAAVNVATSATRVSRERLTAEFVPQLVAAAAAIEQDLRLLRP